MVVTKLHWCPVKRLSVAFCVALAACGGNPLDVGSLAVGPDTSLYVADTNTRADQQDLYLGNMCQRAGISMPGPAEKPACPSRLLPEQWQRVAHAALNDIDDRCEVYLTSLSLAKRDRTAYLAQLRRTASATGLILAVTGVPGSRIGAHAVAIIEAAFGLGEHSLDNYYSRLILEVDATSIQHLVLKRQTAFRQILRNEYIDNVGNKSSVYFVVRAYLRICLPASIEGTIVSSIHDLTYQPRDIRAKQERELDSQTAPGAVGVITRNDPDLESLRAGAMRVRTP